MPTVRNKGGSLDVRGQVIYGRTNTIGHSIRACPRDTAVARVRKAAFCAWLRECELFYKEVTKVVKLNENRAAKKERQSGGGHPIKQQRQQCQPCHTFGPDIQSVHWQKSNVKKRPHLQRSSSVSSTTLYI